MKVAISSTDKNIESNVSEVFGRCPYFIIAEINKEGKIMTKSNVIFRVCFISITNASFHALS